MLNCEFCDYFKSSDGDVRSKNICQYTGFVFHKKVEEYDLENHPCYDYQPNSGAVKVKKVINFNSSELKLA